MLPTFHVVYIMFLCYVVDGVSVHVFEAMLAKEGFEGVLFVIRGRGSAG
jgi:hypothetical protein